MENTTPDPVGEPTPPAGSFDAPEAAPLLSSSQPTPEPPADLSLETEQGLPADPYGDPAVAPIGDAAGEPALDPPTVPGPDLGTTTSTPEPPARPAAVKLDLTPLYALAGLTDALAASVRRSLQESAELARRRRAAAEVTAETTSAEDLEQQAKANAEELRRRFSGLPEQLRTRLQGLQDQAAATYADLAGRGRRAVDDAVVSARTLSERAERRAEDVRAEAVQRIDPAFEAVQDTVTAARRKVTGRDSVSPAAPGATGTAAEADITDLAPPPPTATEVPPLSEHRPDLGQ